MTHRIKPVSYEALYAAHHGEVLRLCRLLLANHDDAEEIAQGVFLKIYKQLQNMNQTELMRWRRWLMRVSVNACGNGRRSGWWRLWRGVIEEYQEPKFPTLAALLKNWFSAEKQ